VGGYRAREGAGSLPSGVNSENSTDLNVGRRPERKSVEVSEFTPANTHVGAGSYRSYRVRPTLLSPV